MKRITHQQQKCKQQLLCFINTNLVHSDSSISFSQKDRYHIYNSKQTRVASVLVLLTSNSCISLWILSASTPRYRSNLSTNDKQASNLLMSWYRHNSRYEEGFLLANCVLLAAVSYYWQWFCQLKSHEYSVILFVPLLNLKWIKTISILPTNLTSYTL